jgi:hypothetical protein
MIDFSFQCPKRWEQLRPTEDEAVRFCDQCRRQVFFCTSLEVAQTHAAVGDCIAVDPRLARQPGDLESNLWETGLVVGMPLIDEEPPDKGDEMPGEGRRGRRKQG